MSAHKLAVLNKSELNELQCWLEASSADLPDSIFDLLSKLITVYLYLAEAKTKSARVLAHLREAMGITPRNESSKRAIGSQASLTDKEKLARLRAQRKGLDRAIKKYENLSCNKTITSKKKTRKESKRADCGIPKQDETPGKNGEDLERPQEQLFGGPLAQNHEIRKKMTVDREAEFDDLIGLHTVRGKRKRMQVNTTVTTINYEVETVTDPRTGKTVTASMDKEGPPGYQVTWDAIANLIMMAVGYAFPISRIAKILQAASSYFSSGRICDLILYGAKLLEPIYSHMGESLAESNVLSGDDTPTNVLEMEELLRQGRATESPKSSLVDKVARIFGRVSFTKKGDRPQKRYNVSLLVGKTNPEDNRSYIYFFHSHLGHLGNLLTKILSIRRPKNKKLVIQTDLLSSNMPSKEIQDKFEITWAGCMSHARRPFFRYRFDEPELSFTMLRAFLILSNIEDDIDEWGRDWETVERYRRRYSYKIWQIIYAYAKATAEGNPLIGEYWPKDTPIRKACEYIVKNFDALTRYCFDPRLELTNNMRERLLRWDKVMLDSSKFRKTEQGRAAINILRTIIHTCSAAKVNSIEYLTYVFQNFRDLEAHPEKYTPYSYALMLDQQGN